MDDLKGIQAIFEAREEVYLQFTNQVWEMIPHVRKAIDESIKQETPNIHDGITWRMQDMGMLEGALLVKVKVSFNVGEYTHEGAEVKITEENQDYFAMSLSYAIPMKLVLVGDHTVILAFINERIAETAEQIKAEVVLQQELTPPAVLTEHGFDMSKLTPEQRLSFELLTKNKQ